MWGIVGLVVFFVLILLTILGVPFDKPAVSIVGAVGIVAVVCLVNGAHSVQDRIRQDAVDHGVAEWVVDQETGKREFKWLAPDEIEERL